MQTILLFDDDRQTLAVLDLFLSSHGYYVLTRTNGVHAIPYIEREKPDLVVLDNRLGYPTDGWGILQEIRVNNATARLPVILYSAKHTFLDKHAQHIRGMGADFLYKPFDFEELRQKIITMIGKEAP